MAFKLNSNGDHREISVLLDYPYLPVSQRPTHYLRRSNREELRKISADFFTGASSQSPEQRSQAIYHFWCQHVLDKTRGEYEGLDPENWKEQLWADQDGKSHIEDAVTGYVNALVPQSFLRV